MVTKNHSLVFAGVVPFAYLAVVFCARALRVVALSSMLYILLVAVDLASDMIHLNPVVVFDLIHVDIVNG